MSIAPDDEMPVVVRGNVITQTEKMVQASHVINQFIRQMYADHRAIAAIPSASTTEGDVFRLTPERPHTIVVHSIHLKMIEQWLYTHGYTTIEMTTARNAHFKAGVVDITLNDINGHTVIKCYTDEYPDPDERNVVLNHVLRQIIDAWKEEWQPYQRLLTAPMPTAEVPGPMPGKESLKRLHSPLQRKEIAAAFRVALATGKVSDRQAWAKEHHSITAKTLNKYLREFPS